MSSWFRMNSSIQISRVTQVCTVTSAPVMTDYTRQRWFSILTTWNATASFNRACGPIRSRLEKNFFEFKTPQYFFRKEISATKSLEEKREIVRSTDVDHFKRSLWESFWNSNKLVPDRILHFHESSSDSFVTNPLRKQEKAKSVRRSCSNFTTLQRYLCVACVCAKTPNGETVSWYLRSFQDSHCFTTIYISDFISSSPYLIPHRVNISFFSDSKTVRYQHTQLSSASGWEKYTRCTGRATHTALLKTFVWIRVWVHDVSSFSVWPL